nr:hypothetical protein [Candidatus Freyrarchaeum guaymaensis]
MMMAVIGICERISIRRVRGVDYFSLFNSPYHAHTYGGAMDVYFLWGGEEVPCLTPGRVVDIRRVRTPSRKFPHEEYDYLIMVKAVERPDLIVRMMHVRPSVQVGDEIELGNGVGRPLRSGFFDPWTSLHVHLEVKRPEDALRAKKSFPIKLEGLSRVSKPFWREEVEGEVLPCEVVFACEDYALASVPSEYIMKVGLFRGVGVRVGRHFGILDCGLPHYNRGGVILKEGVEVEQGTPIMFKGVMMGKVCGKVGSGVTFRVCPLSIMCKGERIRGVSAFISLGKCLIKIIPLKRGEPNFRVGEEVNLEVKGREE